MTTEGGFVVVGVDQSPAARAALEFALGEGLAHHCTVEVVTAWLWTSPYEGIESAGSLAEGERVAQAVQEQELRSVLATRSESPVISRTVVHELAGKALVERAEGARFLVVGSARKGPVARALLGSVSEYCVRHAPAPVVVVAAPERVKHRPPTQVETVSAPAAPSNV